MNELVTKKVQCPYCGETINIQIDCSVPHQRYIEDCQVCCRPINVDVSVDQAGEPSILVTHENE